MINWERTTLPPRTDAMWEPREPSWGHDPEYYASRRTGWPALIFALVGLAVWWWVR